MDSVLRKSDTVKPKIQQRRKKDDTGKIQEKSEKYKENSQLVNKKQIIKKLSWRTLTRIKFENGDKLIRETGALRMEEKSFIGEGTT